MQALTCFHQKLYIAHIIFFMAEIKKQVTVTVNKDSKDLKTKTTVTKTTVPPVTSLLFTKDNYMWMIIGGIVFVLGMFLMSGGKNEDPNTFDYNAVYSTTRITIAPILIILGLLIEVYAIFKKPRTEKV